MTPDIPHICELRRAWSDTGAGDLYLLLSTYNPKITDRLVMAAPLWDMVKIHHLSISKEKLILLSQRMTKPTKWHVRPAKTKIRLGIRIRPV